METSPQFYLELARVTECTWPSRGEAIDTTSLVDSAEHDSLDTSQFVRLPPRFFGVSGNPSWRTIKSRCRSAYPSECFFRCISEEQWLKTVITCNSSDCGFSVHSIHSNVMPKQAYLTWFEGVKGTCSKHRCSLGFFPASFLRGCGETMDLNMLPALCCSNCALVEQLKHQMVAAEFVKFWYLEETDVRVVDDHTETQSGSGGEVRKVLWRHGTFARKQFICDIPYQNKSFLREFDVALKVSHPNIVHCFGWSGGSFDCSLFMEWLEVDLRRFLHERVRDGRKSPFSFRVTLLVLLQVAQAMKHLHEERFVHGDLKPDNLLVSQMAMPPSVQFYLVKVADFGCTQRVDSSGATLEPFSCKIGSRFYTAPEILRCRKYSGSESPECLYKIDVYSFGVVAYQVVTGVESQNFPRGYNIDRVMKPDGHETQWRPNRDFDFDSLEHDRLSLLPLIKRCWASSPQDRPTFQEICHTLWNLCNQFFLELV